jgi:predicted MPP superfamily phosphohydrolase
VAPSAGVSVRSKATSPGLLAGEPRWLFALRGVIVAFGAFGLWVYSINRWLDYFVDGAAKQVVVYGELVALLAIAALLFVRARRKTTLAALVVLAFMILGEIRRLWLRHDYRVNLGSGPETSVTQPITTTALGLRRFEVPLETLPVAKLRVIHLSDFHVTEAFPADYYARVAREVSARKPDLVFITGDSLSQPERLPLFERVLSALPRARFGSFAVLGNHEVWIGRADQVVHAYERAGVTVLRGRCVHVPFPDTPGLRVCGTETPWGPGLTRAAVDVAGAADAPLFALSHTPDNVYDLALLGASAVFAGHTHGGQLRLPWLGALVVPSSHGRLFDFGEFHVNGATLFVSPGVGADQPPLRVYCRPEIFEVNFASRRHGPRAPGP